MQNTGIRVDTSKLLEYSNLIKVSNTLVNSIMIMMVIDQNDDDRNRSSQGMIELPNRNDPLYIATSLQMAGHSFLLSSTHQLRQVLFDELALHKKCQRSLSKTASQKFTSTSEHVVIAVMSL